MPSKPLNARCPRVPVAPKRHPKYYFEDGDIIFLVSSQLQLTTMTTCDAHSMMSGRKWFILHPSPLLHSRECRFPWHAFVSKWLRDSHGRSVRRQADRSPRREEHRLWGHGVDVLQWVSFLDPFMYTGKECSSSRNRKYSDYSASAGEWSSIILLAHMWQFEHMSEVAFQAYAALPSVSSVEKISMCRKYNFPRRDLAAAYLEI